jgi:hypothetical protein
MAGYNLRDAQKRQTLTYSLALPAVGADAPYLIMSRTH